MNKGIILPHNARAKAELTKQIMFNKAIEETWEKIHVAAGTGNCELLVRYSNLLQLNSIQSVFEKYGYTVNRSRRSAIHGLEIRW